MIKTMYNEVKVKEIFKKPEIQTALKKSSRSSNKGNYYGTL